MLTPKEKKRKNELQAPCIFGMDFEVRDLHILYCCFYRQAPPAWSWAIFLRPTLCLCWHICADLVAEIFSIAAATANV